MLDLFRQRRVYVKIVLWMLVVAIAVSLVLYFVPQSSQQPSPPSQTPNQQQQQQAINNQITHLEQLITDYRQKLKTKPDDPNLLEGCARLETQLGEIYLQTGKRDQALTQLKQGVLLYQKLLAIKDTPSLRLELAQAQELEGDYQNADQQCQQILAKDPKNEDALFLHGRLREELQDWQGAQEVWQQLSNSGSPDVQQYAREHLKAVKQKLK